MSLGTALFLVAILAGLGPLAVDPTYLHVGTEVTPEDIARVRAEIGLSGSFPERFARNVVDLAQMDLGNSLRLGTPVGQLVIHRLGVTVKLVGWAVAGSLVVGTLLSILFRRYGNLRRYGIPSLAVIGMGIPIFILASIVAELFPNVVGSPSGRMAAGAILLALPAVAFYGITLTRRLQALNQERFVFYGSVHGLPNSVVDRWVFRLAFVEALAIAGNQVTIAAAGGTIVVEFALRIEGIGLLLYDASTWMDLPVLRVLLVGTAIALGGAFLFLDVIHSMLDPRRALEGS